jgi:RNA polymerase sigma-70 factor (ECF subfamily)
MIDDSALLQVAKKLDRDGLTAIFDTYAPAIYRYALHLCNDPIDSDNIVGDVFSLLLEQIASGKGPATNLRSYLYQIAYHLIVDRARHNHRMIDLEVVSERSMQVSPSPQMQVEEHNLMDAVILALNSDLTDDQRHVIVLRFLEGFSLKETAAILEKRLGSVKVIQNRAMARLKIALSLGRRNTRSAGLLQSDTC